MNTPISRVLLAVGILGLGGTAYILYQLVKSSDDEDEEEEEKKRTATSRHTVIEVEIPGRAAGGIIGRQGSHIKEIQKNSGARIHFKDDMPSDLDKNRILLIRGTEENAQKAELIVREYINNMPVNITENITVPSSALGRIIGRGGDTIRRIYMTSKTKIYIDRTRDEYRDVDRQVQITGTRQQIDLAKTLIEEKVQEEAVFRAKKSVMEANREKRNKPNSEERLQQSSDNSKERLQQSSDNSKERLQHPWNDNQHQQNDEINTEEPTKQMLENVSKQTYTWPTGRDYIEVYVSSVANPSTFFVQIITSMSIQLDDLVKEMSTYYSTDRQEDRVVSPCVGDYVAAPFRGDTSWYRAKVAGFQAGSCDELDIFYLDYGDSCYMNKSEVKILRSDFFPFPFQAIECELANVTSKGGSWEEEVVDRFEDMTYAAQWKVLMAKLIKINHLPSGEKIHMVELVDTNGQKDVNIGEQLCSEGLAEWIGES